MKIGAVSKLLNIPVTTIRFYEEEGILTPERRESGYRDYAMLDVFNLMECIRYRNMGLTVKEVARSLHEEGMEYLKEQVDKNILRLREEISLSGRLLSNLQELAGKLDALSLNVGRTWAVPQPERFYVAVGEDTKEDYGRPNLREDIIQAWLSHLPFVYGAYMMGEEGSLLHVLMAEKETAACFGLETEGTLLPMQLCLTTIYAEEKDTPPKAEEFWQAFGEEKDRLQKEMLVARLLIRCREVGGPKRYWEVMAPYKEEAGRTR